MKCTKCGAELDGKICRGCGTENEFIMPTATAPKSKKKKPFFLRWWFILLVIIVAFFLLVDPDSDSGDKIVWNDMILGDMLPEPPNDEGHLYTNAKDELSLEVDDLSSKQFDDYIEDCKEKGFEIDSKYTSSSYNAYNSEGYELSLSHYGDNSGMSIELNAPMEMEEITWPISNAGNKVPKPKSTIGNFSYERDNEFLVYIGDTTKNEYVKYVDSCSKKGFNVDYEKADNYYKANDNEGWQIHIIYQGNNIMSIEVTAPSTETEETKETEESSTDNKLSTDFKAAMDSYETFMNEYVAFMKKYKANPTDADLISDYSDYMSKYVDFVADFEKWEDEDMNEEELAYYIEVQTRVSKKLLEATQ